MRLLVSVLPALLATLLLAGCEQPDRGERPVTIAGTTFPNTMGERHWLDFAKGVEDSTDLSLRLLIYGQLGSEDQLVSGLRRGRVQFANLSAMAVSTVVPEMALLYAPFLFDNEAESDYVYDNYLTPLYSEMLAEKGLHLVSWYEIGFIQVYGKEPLLLPDDVIGRRFRVGAGPAARLFAKAVGADVIPLGFADVVASLQTGLIEAGENAVSLYARTGIAGEAPHLTLTNHSFGVSAIVASKTWWDTLTPQQQQAVTDAWPGASAVRREVRAESTADIEAGSELGITVHRISAADRNRWRDAAAPVTDQLIESIGGRSAEIHSVIQQGRQAFAELNESHADIQQSLR